MNFCVLHGVFGLALLLISRPASAQAPADFALPAVPAFRQDASVLLQGDSITDGNRGRNLNPNHILGHGYPFIVAAKYGAALAKRNLTFLNRGVSGNTALDLAKRWQKVTLDLRSNILSILIGVNDNSQEMPLDQYKQTYDKLLADARGANPDLRLVLCAPFTLPVGKKLDSGPSASYLFRPRTYGGRMGADGAGVLAGAVANQAPK